MRYIRIQRAHLLSTLVPQQEAYEKMENFYFSHRGILYA